MTGNQAHSGGEKSWERGKKDALGIGGTGLIKAFVTEPDSVEMRHLFSLNVVKHKSHEVEEETISCDFLG